MKILITGASSGIGFLTGCVLIERGHDVYMTTKTDEELKTLNDKLSYLDIYSNTFKLDVTSSQDRQKIKELDLDCLFLHAGVGYTGLLENIDINLVKDNFEVNVFSNLMLIQEYLKTGSNPKKVVMTSSLLANHSLPFFGSYVMTKTTIDIMIKTLRRENFFSDNKFILIKPGAYHTGYNQYMILSGEKSGMNPDTMKILNKMFLLIEKKSLNDIVYKIVLAIEKGNKNIYTAPFIQTFLSKLTF